MFISSTNAHAIGQWDWHDLGKAETAFCEKQVPPALELRKTRGNNAALAALDAIYQLAEREFRDPAFFHRVIWFEAEVKGGKDDEEWGLALYEYLLERDLKKSLKLGVRIQGADYILYGNIVGGNEDLGRIAKARSVCMSMEDSLKRENFDTSGASYEDLGSNLFLLSR